MPHAHFILITPDAAAHELKAITSPIFSYFAAAVLPSSSPAY